jgi:sRNA-binding protein
MGGVSRGERVVAAFAERWPACFSRERPVLPLKVGIDGDILAAGGFDEAAVRRGLAWYVNRSPYLRAVFKGECRIGLDGSVAGQITKAGREYAAERMTRRAAEMAAKKTAKKAAKVLGVSHTTVQNDAGNKVAEGGNKLATRAEKEAEVKAAEAAANAEQCPAFAVTEVAVNPEQCSTSAPSQKATQPKRLSLRDLKAAAVARRAGSPGAA